MPPTIWPPLIKSCRCSFCGCGARSLISFLVGPQEHLLATVKRRKHASFRHVTRHDSVSKTILQGCLEGGWCHGWQRKCWMDNIKEWTSLPMPELLTRASCKKDWKRISTKSFLMSVWWPDLSRDWTELNYWKVDDRSWMCTVTFMHAIKLKESCPHFPFAIIPESDYCQCTPSRSRKNRNMVIHLVKYRIQALATRFI